MTRVTKNTDGQKVIAKMTKESFGLAVYAYRCIHCFSVTWVSNYLGPLYVE